jgi:hypothetical protein
MAVKYDEINGFEIDNFNQYNLVTGKNTGDLSSVLPILDRPKTKKHIVHHTIGIVVLERVTIAVQRFSSTPFKRKGMSDKEYIKPPEKKIIEVSTKIEEWFADRGISKKTLNDLRVTEGFEYMPQTGKEENTIQFNYFIGDELINVKYRDGRKKLQAL